MLHDSLRVCEEQLALVNSMQAVLQNEEELLKANRQIGSSEKGLVLAELKQIADF